MFLVLHGQTEWNRDGRLQGHSNSPLTDEGVRQVLRTAAILKAHMRGPARLVASPLGRTLATARLLGDALGVPHVAIETDARLAELRLGCWEGLTRDQIAAGWPDRWNTTARNRSFFHSPGGEDYDAIGARLRDWLAERTAHDDLVVVSHGIASRVLRGIYQGLSRDEACELAVARDAPFRLWEGRVEKLDPP
jgi:broad specificity phosphatase PhoE